MATFGIRGWNAQGQRTLDISDRLTKVLGQFNIEYVGAGSSSSFTSHVVTIPSDLSGSDVWFASVAVSKTNSRYPNDAKYSDDGYLRMEQSGNVLTFKLGNQGNIIVNMGTKVVHTIVYGAY